MMYKLFKHNQEDVSVIRTADNTSIPFDLANVDYQEYLKWVEMGGVPLPADEV